MADGYGPGTNGPFQVALETNGDPDADDRGRRVGKALAAEPGVASVGPAVTNDAR